MPAPHVACDPDPDANLRIELYGRVSGNVVRTVVDYRDRLEALATEGALDDVELVPWPDRVELTEDEHDTVAAYERFGEWAEETGTELGPAFTVQTYESEYLGHVGTTLMTPVACAAVFEDDDLVAVYPHEDGGDVYTVEDAVSTLETMAVTATDADADAGADLAVGEGEK
jgi:hypothetical protein